MKVREAAIRLRGYLRRAALLVLILWMLVDIRVRLWRQPYARVRAHVDSLARRGPRFRDVGPMWIVRWVERVGLIVPKGTCLVRALATQALLARRGVPVEVVFGARFSVSRLDGARKFEAHAWVEYHGRVLIGDLPDLTDHHVLRREVIGGGQA